MGKDYGSRYDFVGTITNSETGEIMPAVVKKAAVHGPLQFALVNRHLLFDIFSKLDGGTKDVLCIILRDMKDYTNVFSGTFKSIEAKAGASSATVSRAMKELQKYDVVRMVKQGEWAVNPALCWTTDTDKQRGLLYWYSTLETQADRKNRKAKKKESEESDVLRYSENGVEE